LSDEELRARFWGLAERIVAPLVEEARTHTTPAIERSVLLRMGLSSMEAKELTRRFAERDLLPHGAGRLVAVLAARHGVTPREAARELLDGRWWEEVQP
jgi:D-ornithine 4,5-aminomutase subunit alpha